MDTILSKEEAKKAEQKKKKAEYSKKYYEKMKALKEKEENDAYQKRKNEYIMYKRWESKNHYDEDLYVERDGMLIERDGVFYP